jgi:hypothetical protein
VCVKREARHVVGQDVLNRMPLVVVVLLRAVYRRLTLLLALSITGLPNRPRPTPYQDVSGRLMGVEEVDGVDGMGSTASNLFFLLSNDVCTGKKRARR